MCDGVFVWLKNTAGILFSSSFMGKYFESTSHIKEISAKTSTSNYVRIDIQSNLVIVAFYFSAQTFSIVCLSNCFRSVSFKKRSRGRIIFDIVKRLKKPI